MQVKLKVLSGSSAGRELKIPGEEFFIGRSDACQLRPKSDSISRKHCVLRVREGRLFVEDLGSRNGTFVDGRRLAEETEVQHGCQLRLGRLEFEVILEQPAPVAESAKVKAGESAKADSKAGGALVDEDSVAEDNDITKWLEEGDSDAQQAKRTDPDSRQFRLDDTERVATETTVMPLGEADTKAGVPEGKSESPETVEDKDGGKGKGKVKEEKKKPGKLPPRSVVATGDSRQAASDMLKRFFNRP
jgi:predicted component of type VI protein secretion system